MHPLQSFYRGKRVLITGHTGFKGSWLTQVLLNWGADVAGVALAPDTRPNLFTLLGQSKRMRSHLCDIRDFPALRKIIQKERPEIIFHLAAQALVRRGYESPLETYETNVIGTANVLHAAHDVGSAKSIVVITTDKVYENLETGRAFKETDPLGGHDPYSASKAAADIVAASYIKSFFTDRRTHAAIARAGNVVGGGDWSRDRIMHDIVRAVFESRRPVVVRFPESVRPWQFVLEPLWGYLVLGQELYRKNRAAVGPWNFGPRAGSFVSVRKLLSIMFRNFGRGSFRVQREKVRHEAGVLKLSIAKATAGLPWKPIYPLQKTLAVTAEWYQTYYLSRREIAELTNRQIDDFFRLAARRQT
ncbi:MAG: CDP-glucose 4,6-dehydratase [Candidatus Kerfeldbacteria bacterium]|nr:CDP-glucose 4,6-dehydratase [Candidatus Kerfeldbacteria bacterium]